MSKVRIKKEDQVFVIKGKDRDLTTTRRVLQVLPKQQRVLVEGANMAKRHTKPNPQKNIKGGVLEVPAFENDEVHKPEPTGRRAD